MSITVRDVAQAMIDDTTDKATGDFIFDEDGNSRYNLPDNQNVYGVDLGYTVGSTCAVGGAALSLGIIPEDLYNELIKVDKDGVPIDEGLIEPNKYVLESVRTSIGNLITTLNDDTDMTKAEIGHLILDNADEETLGTVVIDD